jgi:hypothetical protein
MIRSRPTTQNVEVLEKLAGVKQGTKERLSDPYRGLDNLSFGVVESR